MSTTYSALELTPAHRLASLGLGGIINENALLQNVRFSLAEVSVLEEGNGLRGRLGECHQEVGGSSNGVDAFDLQGKPELVTSNHSGPV